MLWSFPLSLSIYHLILIKLIGMLIDAGALLVVDVKTLVMIHSDQGSQFGSDDFNRWCKDNQLVPSMSRRGNCWDNAVAESFFSSLKKERIKC
jgi:hypothetical protein